MISADEYDRVLDDVRTKWGPLADARGPLFVPVEVRTVMLVSSIGGVIDNGGFEYLLEAVWEGDEDLVQAVDAFRRIGCPDQADVIAFVMTHFKLQAGSSLLDPGERVAAFEAAFPFGEARIDLASRFWSNREEIKKKLTDYILTNKQKIDEQLVLDVKKWLSHIDR